MSHVTLTRRDLGRLALALIAVAAAFRPAFAQDATPVIQLTQVGCQFIEAEGGIDHGFQPQQPVDCKAINDRTATARLAQAAQLELSPGRYSFRVTNHSVPYDLGFWLRAIDYDKGNPWHRLNRLSVEFAGLKLGETRSIVVHLKEGEYLYSCPNNPTPNYVLIVQ